MRAHFFLVLLLLELQVAQLFVFPHLPSLLLTQKCNRATSRGICATLDDLLGHLCVRPKCRLEVVWIPEEVVLFFDLTQGLNFGLSCRQHMLVAILNRQNGLPTIALLFLIQNLL